MHPSSGCRPHTRLRWPQCHPSRKAAPHSTGPHACAPCPPTPVQDIKRWRESEVVHGRVAMLAALGFVVGEQLEDFPAFINFDGSINGEGVGEGGGGRVAEAASWPPSWTMRFVSFYC